jgi:glycosyltransferase involved in cell wall biosynthesis
MQGVSAVIPVHNGAPYLAEAIASVLGQTRPPIECLVIDDGSTDATPQIARSFEEQITYVRVERGGVSRARNHGARRSSGEMVAFLDHDDVWLPPKLERQLEALGELPEAPMALCAVEVIDAGGRPRRIKRLRAREDLIAGMITFDGTETVSCSSAGLVRRDWLLASGGFDPDLSMSADWDLLLRALLHGGVAYVDEPLVRYRVHGSNMSRNIAAMERDMRRAFAKAFAEPLLPDAVRARRRRAYGRLYRMLAGSYRDSGDRLAMLRSLAIALGHDPALSWALLARVSPAPRARRRPSSA